MTDAEIFKTLLDIDPQTNRAPPGMLQFARAIEAAARAEQHAECVRLMEEYDKLTGETNATYWLESHKP